MQMLVAAVYDVKVGAFNLPMCFRSKGEAIRSFSGAVQDEKSQFSQNKADYRLVALAMWDDNSGGFTPHPPETLIEASDVG